MAEEATDAFYRNQALLDELQSEVTVAEEDIPIEGGDGSVRYPVLTAALRGSSGNRTREAGPGRFILRSTAAGAPRRNSTIPSGLRWRIITPIPV